MEKDKLYRVALAKKHLERAKSSLLAAEKLLEANLYADSLSRSYYAAYHSGYAGLYVLGYEPNTHKGLQNLIFIHLIETELIPKKALKNISILMEERGTADYGALPLIENDDAVNGIQLAKYVISEFDEFIKQYE